MLPPSHYVKWRLRKSGARSAFTKAGPGRRKRLHEALLDLTQDQRAVAKAKGWDQGMLRKSRLTGDLVVVR